MPLCILFCIPTINGQMLGTWLEFCRKCSVNGFGMSGNHKVLTFEPEQKGTVTTVCRF